MYTPHYYDALLELCPAEVVVIDYSMYVEQILRRKHCEMQKNTVNKGIKPYFYILKGVNRMKIKASAGEFSYLAEEISRLLPVNIEGTLEVTDEEQEKAPEESLGIGVKQILLEKMKEMAGIKFGDCANGEYPEICSVMNDIAKTLLEK